MNYSEIATSEQKKQTEISDLLEKLSSSSTRKKLFPLKVIEYLFLTAFVCSGIITFVIPNNIVVIADAVSIALFIFVSLINKQLFHTYTSLAKELELKNKAESYIINNDLRATKLYLVNNTHTTKNPINQAREKALQYSQELIDDYKKTRNQSRNLYYAFQMATIILSGVTPILVLVDKLITEQAVLMWLTVICPAFASIVASVATSFPFQENLIAANTAVELLEAEQEKFVLGVTPPYRCYDTSESEQEQKARQAIENFIVQVNNIHLKQFQEVSENQSKEDKTQPEKSDQ